MGRDSEGGRGGILRRFVRDELIEKVSQVAQTVKNLPAMPETQETWIRSLGQKHPLEKGMATHSSILAWGIPLDRGACQATVHVVTKSWV